MMTSQAYYAINNQWPKSLEELKKTFSKREGGFDLEQYKEVIFLPQADNSLGIEYSLKADPVEIHTATATVPKFKRNK
jgi:hypothetical protein